MNLGNMITHSVDRHREQWWLINLAKATHPVYKMLRFIQREPDTYTLFLHATPIISQARGKKSVHSLLVLSTNKKKKKKQQQVLLMGT